LINELFLPAATALRMLSVDMVQRANSGHPGMPLGMADIAAVLWLQFLRHNPHNPQWPNRDRFVLSNGHGSALLYSLLHLTGYQVSIEDLKDFRQLHSITPGHPEHGLTPGVDATTGPLGQGLANAVGMALASKILAARFNKPNLSLFDNFVYCFVGDGCLMEGISHEACSFAGTNSLNNLIVVWDDNGISIDGRVENWCTDNVALRFQSYGWHTIEIDGHDYAQIEQALTNARLQTKPVLIACKTLIGYGSPNFAGTETCHGSPFKADEMLKIRQQLSWSHEPFVIPIEIYAAMDARETGYALEQAWQAQLVNYQHLYPADYQQLARRLTNELPENWQDFISNINAPICATRRASQIVLEHLELPELLGGSADLACSNLTSTSKSSFISKANFNGNSIHYGVREFAMAAIMNGIALFGGFIVYGGTFLSFSDYARNAIRMSALMRLRVIYVFTHDSIGLGEDGPTHQPVEHLASLRLIPNLEVWRPATVLETAIAWQMAILNFSKPSCLCLSRQVSAATSNFAMLENISKGGYIYQSNAAALKLVIIATGTELGLVLAALTQLPAPVRDNIQLVSMPCGEKFLQQATAYRNAVLPAQIPRLIVEAGSSLIWHRFLNGAGKILGVDTFGHSAPGDKVYASVGLNAANIIINIQELIRGEI
jgi:transketolase